MPSLFISHSGNDHAALAQLVEHLDAHGHVSLFLDTDATRGIAGGAHWESELYSQLRRADAVLFVSTASSVASHWCFAELAMARSLGKPVIPVSLGGEVVHPLLADVQRVEMAKEDGLTRLRQALQAAELNPGASFAWDPRRSPFPGLAAFQEADAGVFFGRAREIDPLLEFLNSSRRRYTGRLLGVVGPSGSGKSSLAAAGLLPRLRQSRRPWILIPPLRPGERPLRQLALVLDGAYRAAGRPRSPAELEDALAEGPAALVRMAEELSHLGAGEGEAAVLLVVDQAEELVTLAGRHEGERFLELLHAATRGSGPLWGVVTLRSEFLSPLLQWESAAPFFDEEVLVGPLDRGRLPEVIELPAARAGIDFAPGLVARIVEDTGGGDALPLLAFTLSELVDDARSSGDHVIAAKTYDRLGGVIGALRRRADQVHKSLRTQGLGDVVLPTLMRLVTIGAEGLPTRRRLVRSTLEEREERVIDAFLEARLLASGSRDGQAIVEVAHEALFRQWRPLAEAVEGSSDDIRLRSELERSAADWRRSGYRDEYLFSGYRLHVAQRLGERDGQPLVQQFLAAGAARERRRETARTYRKRGAVAAALLIAALALAALIPPDDSPQPSGLSLADSWEMAFAGNALEFVSQGYDGRINVYDWRPFATVPPGIRDGGFYEVSFDSDLGAVGRLNVLREGDRIRVAVCRRCRTVQDVIALAQSRRPRSLGGQGTP
jgi:Novel STAND NTPase 1/TIR domain